MPDSASEDISTPQHPSTGRGVLLRLIRRHWRRISAYCALLLQWQLCEALVPVFIGIIIDRAVTTGDAPAMLLWGAGLMLLFLVLSASYRFGARIGFGVVQRETHQLRVEIAEHVLDPRGVKTTSLTGEVLSLATNDAEAAGAVTRSLGFAIAATASVSLSAVILLRTDVVLGLLVIVGVPLVIAIIQLVTPVISRRSAQQQERVALASGLATDFIRGLRILKGVGAERVASQRYAKRSQAAREASIRTTTSFGLMEGITVGLSGGFLALVALLAGQRALAGEITIGELVAVVGLTQFIAEPLSGLGRVGAQVGMAYASAGRIASFLSSPRLIPAGTRARSGAVDLVLDGVSSERVRDFTCHVRPGELVGVVVDDPAVAGELVRLLNGERAPTAGAVRLGGQPLSELTMVARRAVLLVNPHHTDLFEGTLRDNVDLGTGLADQITTAVLRASAADEVVDLHPDRLAQPVTTGGKTFSGGQQQRIALARALATDAPILVLHDPTSAVDAVTEQRIASGIRELRHGVGSTRITVLLTTSPAHLAQADRVVVLRDGAVVADGRPHEVAEHDDYRELVLR